ncbi:MAG: elongation factor G [Planctomycetota bacterium]
MMKVEDTRNIAFIGHGDSGKTSLTELMLFKAKAATRLGEVSEGTTACDSEPDEKERKHSIDCGLVYFKWKDKNLNIIDAPGYPDFVAEAISGLSAADAAFIAINAASGIMVNTRKMWDHATNLNVPKAIIITKLDIPNVNFDEIMASVREVFGDKCLLVTSPSGAGAELKSVANLMDAPDKLTPELKKLRDQLIEAVVEVNDTLLNKYLDGKDISETEITGAFRLAILKGKVIPVLATSMKKDVGVDELMDFIVKYLPSPADRGAKTAFSTEKDSKTEENFQPVDNGTFSAYMFKCVSDPFVGRLSYLRIYSGALDANGTLYNPRTRKSERFAKMFRIFGKEQRPIDKASCGDIVVIPKLEDVNIGDTVFTVEKSFRFPEVKFPQPMVSLAAEPKSKGDEQRLSLALTKMSQSDPAFKVVRDRQTHELVITGMSSLHIDVLLNRLKSKYDVQLNTKQPKIPYKETILAKSAASHKHKKQSGGRGQYGEVYMRLEPLPRSEGFKFVDEIFGGSIPSQYLPAIEKGVVDVMDKGVIAGYPVVDVQVTVYDGSYHEVDSSEAAFKIAGSKAFKAAFMQGKPSLLEPIVNIEITTPSKYMGDITGDLNSRRGRITGMDTSGGQQIIKATIPLGEIANYSTELRSITAGEAHYSIEFSHYDTVPHKVQEAIVAKSKPQEEKEEE